MIFTPDEINLICIYDTSNRERLINEMAGSLEFIEEQELAEIMRSALSKLSAMTDGEFAEIELLPTVTAEDTEEQYGSSV